MNLVITGKPGEPMSTWCSAYHTRVPDMPVYLIDKQGRWRGHTTCAGDNTAKEMDDLIDKGLLGTEKCSLRLEE
jgi:hypothetical protein